MPKPLLLFFTLFYLFATSAIVRGQHYGVRGIPADLLKDADAVMRVMDRKVEIKSASEVYTTTTYAITVLNEKGKKMGALAQYYNKFISIKSISGTLYDKDGNEVERLKNKNVKDYGSGEYSLIDDHRVKYFDFGYSNFPYTCEYEVVEKWSETFMIRPWAVQWAHNVAVQSASLTVEFPEDFPLRHRTFNMGDNAPGTFSFKDQLKEGLKTLSWTCANIPAHTDNDEHAQQKDFEGPNVILAADKFSIEDMDGGMATWAEFGEFYYRLNKGRDNLPDSIKNVVHRLADTCATEAAKIKALYRYLQKTTRYVSIQLGIGGWQTLDAGFVAEKSYGDCKALSNYMRALLKEAGITSYLTLVSAGAEGGNNLLKDFPFSRFNHCILSVPNNGDTVWLECTSKTLPAGYLSSFTHDRLVLVSTPGGGYVARTPKYGPEVNVRSRTARLTLGKDDEISGDLEVCLKGVYWDDENHAVNNKMRSEVIEHLNKKLNLDKAKCGNYKISETNVNKVPFYNEHVSFTGQAKASRSDKYLFLNPFFFHSPIDDQTLEPERKVPFELHQGFSVSDTLIYTLDASYTMNKAPEEANMNMDFAHYTCKCELKDDKTLVFISNCSMEAGVYPADKWADYLSLRKKIKNSLSEKVVLLRKD